MNHLIAASLICVTTGALAQQSDLSFFVTSSGSGKGARVNGRGDTPNMHDILTGSQPDGRAFPAAEDRTCGNWTKGGEGGGSGAAMVGHHDRMGLRDDEPSRSWNSSHPSRGCSQDALKSSGGNGYFYCFAAK